MGTKKLNWRTLAMMGFTVVWGFGNVVNNYANQGLTVVVSWLLILTFYFLPYALMVGEMGSVFENKGGGVSKKLTLSIESCKIYIDIYVIMTHR